MSSNRYGYPLTLFFLVFIAMGVFCPRPVFADVCSDGVAFPPFVSKGLDANLLMIIDNSASMYDLAYVPESAAQQGYCYDDTYDVTKTYAGYFDSDIDQWYIYNKSTAQFEADTYDNVRTQFHAASGTIYRGGTSPDRYARIVLKEWTNPHEVTFFAATGNFLNWAAASKFDVEKKVLTGGKYDSSQQQLIMESRGCMDLTFVKQAPVIKDTDGSTANLSLGIISEPDALSEHLTRIEIYDISPTGFQPVNCQEAIDAFSSSAAGSLGDVKNYTTSCLDPLNTGLLDSQTAFLHIMQECWYYNAHGEWQPGAGTVSSLKSDCQNVYAGDFATGNPPYVPADEADYLANYAPDVQSRSDVCYGKYGTSEGFVGRCWEAFYETSYNCVDRTCDPATDTPTGVSTSATQPASEVCATDLNKWIYCNGNYSEANHKCVGSPGNWEVRQDCVGAGAIKEIDWTDDTNGTFIESGLFANADDCVDQSLQKWCGNVDDPGVVDPTDAMSSTGTTYNVPALLVDSAVDAQLHAPLMTMKGLIVKASPPTGLLHEYQGQIRMGAMAFNDGPASECEPVEQPLYSGRYVANLYDCLQDKGTDITGSSSEDATQRDGAHIISYIAKGSSHTDQLVSAINDIEATTWTPTAEAYYNALGYYTQDTNKRFALDDFLLNSDIGGPYPTTITAGPYPLWTRNTVYPKSDWTTNPPTVSIVRDANDNLYWTDDGGTSSQYQDDGTTPATEIGHDTDVVWMPFDPVQTLCQKNNILILTDGASTADHHDAVVNLAANIVDWNETAADTDPLASLPHECGSLEGSTLLDDLTYFGFNDYIYTDARFTDENGNPVSGDNIRTYLVSTGTLRNVVTAGLEAECDSETLLDSAAANGYDLDPATGTPLGELFMAEDPSDLGYKLRAVFNDIRAGRASGSAASVISSSRSGEGAIYQALFFTSHVDNDMREINWAGDVHSLWLDRYGNIREDCGPATCANPCDPATCQADQTLDLETDNIVSFYTDSTQGGMALARRYSDADGDGRFDAMGCSDGVSTTETDCTAGGGTWDYSYSGDFLGGSINLQEIKYIWSAGEWLAAAEPGQKANYSDVPAAGAPARYIFTWLPDTGDIVPFTTTGMAAALTANEYLGYLQAADATEADAIVNFIRGEDQAGYRSRLIDWDNDGTPETYKLGDVVHSTPTIVSRPAEDYDVIYGDDSYRAFRKQYENRRTMIYAGGNDGGLHAFNGGYFDRSTNQFLEAPPAAGLSQYDLGTEIWMFIPYNLLPHLGCLADENYDIGSHKYYVDLKPKIFDAKIFDPDDGIHTGGWGTLLVGGMRFGGGDVEVDTDGDNVDDETLRSAYFILDITNPECPPVVLAEFTHADLGFTTSYPTAIPMLDCTRGVDCPADQSATTWPMNWYLAFGSGPHDASTQTAIEGRSDQKAKLFVLKLGGTDPADYVYTTSPQVTPSGSCPNLFVHNRPALEAGYPKEIAPMCSDPSITVEANCTPLGHDWEDFPKSFFGDLITVDFDLSFQADVLYLGSTANTDLPLDDHTGGLHRFVINNVDNPALWNFSTMLNLGQPVSAAPAAAYDGRNYWLYFGTGRFFTRDDKSTTAQQSFYGVKEQDRSGAFDLYAPNDGDLVDVSNVGVYHGGTLTSQPSSTGGRITAFPITLPTIPIDVWTFAGLKNAMADFDGWKIDFDLTGERNLGQAAVLGDIVTFTTYVPSANVCAAEGDSFLWAPYYKTGTSYFRSVIGEEYDAFTSQFKVLRKLSLGSGLSTTPNIHSGAGQEGTKAFVQTSTGAIIGIKQANPGVIKSGPASWRELLGN